MSYRLKIEVFRYLVTKINKYSKMAGTIVDDDIQKTVGDTFFTVSYRLIYWAWNHFRCFSLW